MSKTTGSIDLQAEANLRLEHLYVSHSLWLKSVARNVTKDGEEADELVSELYLYLADKPNPDIFYSTSYNLMYCRSFIRCRWINQQKRRKRFVPLGDAWDLVEGEGYDTEKDEKFDRVWGDMMSELEELKRSKIWGSALLFEHYYFSDKTLQQLSKEIGISLSTTFMHTKRVKDHLKGKLDNPFE